MSDILNRPSSPRGPRPKPRGASSKVLEWIADCIRSQNLSVGDSLPAELEIAQAVRVGRSSVREALTALKVLGIIESRRKGGIRIVRDPVLLELRHYFSPLKPGSQYDDAMEFRAALESGLGRLMLHRATPATIRKLRSILQTVSDGEPDWTRIAEAEIEFHGVLTLACGNRLAALFSHLYRPIFEIGAPGQHPATHADITRWIKDHALLIESLERCDEPAFLAALSIHIEPYMRLSSKSAPSRRDKPR